MNIKLKTKRAPKRPKVKALDPVLGRNPQKSGIVIKVFTATPKKPNSASRKVAKVRLKVKVGKKTVEREINCYIPGEKHKLQANQRVIIRGGGAKDLIGANYSVVRGAGDCNSVEGRINGGSKYGASVKKNRAAAAALKGGK